MKRRDFLKASTALGLLACCPTFLSGATNYNGKLLITVFAAGGWDPTSFCDPKVNVAGQPIINNWAKTKGAQKAGNISYAPFAKNKEFFTKHYKKMLVINGIDQTTNSHAVGETYALTGTRKGGYPSVAALLASEYKTDELMPWIHNGIRPRSAELLAPTFVNRNTLSKLQVLAEPNLQKAGQSTKYVPEDDLKIIKLFRDRFAKARANDTREMPKQRNQYAKYLDATHADNKFKNFLDYMENADAKGLDPKHKAYAPAIVAVSGLAAGVTLAAEYRVANFDSHVDHDNRHSQRMTELTNSIDLIWNLAEQFGIKDRLIVHVTSDLGRRNKYNNKGGKEHGTTNSTLIMGDNPSWGNRVVGRTTNTHFPEKINFDTLKVDPNGTVMEPKDITAALASFLGASKSKFDLDVNDTLDLFNPNKRT